MAADGPPAVGGHDHQLAAHPVNGLADPDIAGHNGRHD
jgi:hypothetical protein